jgi:hypothetical protein
MGENLGANGNSVETYLKCLPLFAKRAHRNFVELCKKLGGSL